jgi:Fe(3+) dicitrate transport protein
VEPRLEQRFSTGSLGHTLYAGTRLLAEWGERQQRRGELASSASGELETHETSRTIAVAAFAQDKIAVTDWLIATPGVRFEYAHFRRHIRRAFVEGAPRDVRVVGTSDLYEVIPGVGMIAGTRTDHVFAGAHVGFAPPRLATAIDDEGVDEQLEAERSISYEVGARTAPARGVKLEATGFLMSFSNQVIPAPAGRQGSVVNAGQTRHVGLESGLTVGVGDALRWSTSLDVGGRYTLSRATFVGGANDGNALPYAPLHIASAYVDTQHPSGVGGQVAWSYQGDQFTDDANSLLEDTAGRVGLIPAYQSLDVSARYRHARSGLTLGASVKSVLNDVYVLARRPDGIFPGGFRRFFVSLRWDWVENP